MTILDKLIKIIIIIITHTVVRVKIKIPNFCFLKLRTSIYQKRKIHFGTWIDTWFDNPQSLAICRSLVAVVLESFVEIRCCCVAAAALRAPSLLWPLSAPRPSVSPFVVE